MVLELTPIPDIRNESDKQKEEKEKSIAISLGHQWPTFEPRYYDSPSSRYDYYMYEAGPERMRILLKRREIKEAVERGFTAERWKHRNKAGYDKDGNAIFWQWALMVIVPLVIYAVAMIPK